MVAFDGRVEIKFWNSIFKSYTPGVSGGTERVMGWILNFFPYWEILGKPKKLTPRSLQTIYEIYDRSKKGK